MADGYELRSDEVPFEALGRIVAEQMNATAASLRDPNTKISERVHESRKRFKEIRALLRLFREPLGSEQFTVENFWYRDAGRDIADYRDADVVVAAVGSLPRKVKRQLGLVTMRRLRRVTSQEHRAVYHDDETAEARMENIAAQLPVAAGRVNNLVPTTFDGFASIEPGLIRTLRAGKRAMREAYLSRDPLAFHEWRKRVKDHWYHVQLLKSLGNARLKKREELLNKLSHILGEHHDLQVIREIVAAAESAFGPPESKQIDDTLAARQRQLERKAKSLGVKIYSEGPKRFTRRMGKRWDRLQRRTSAASL